MKSLRTKICCIIVLILAMLIIECAATAESGTFDATLTWTLEDGVLTIGGRGTMSDQYAYLKPTAYYPWSSKRDLITTVVIENGVENVGEYAFYQCSNLQSVVIQNGVTSIGRSAFHSCSKLTEVTLPESLNYIGSNAFYNCGELTNVVIPESIETIASGAFTNCPAPMNYDLNSNAARALSKAGYNFRAPNRPYDLRYRNSYSDELVLTYYDKDVDSAVFLDDITEIGANAFTNCNNISEIIIPESVAYVDSYAFKNCPAIRYAKIDSNVAKALSIAGYSFRITGNPCDLQYQYSYYNGGKTELAVIGCDVDSTEIIIPDGVVLIYYEAFKNNQKLQNVTMPDSVTAIGSYAFYNCQNIKSILLSENVTRIGDSVFDWNHPKLYTSLNSDTAKTLSKARYSFRITGQSYDMRYEYFEDTITGISLTRCDQDVTSVVIPNYVTNISSRAFAYCSNLISVTIPDSVISLGYESFCGCKKLESVILSENLLSIGENAFSQCENIESITIPDSVNSIDKWAFYECGKLKSVTIPSGLTEIKEGVFASCGLTSLTIPEGIHTIGGYAFNNCTDLKIITIPTSVNSIGNYAFNGCPAPLYAEIGSDLALLLSVSGHSFRIPDTEYDLIYVDNGNGLSGIEIQSCDKNLVSFVVPEYVTSIGNSAFKDCNNMTSVIIPSSVKEIKESAFSGCENLINVAISDGVEKIGDYAFSDCESLKSIVLPDSVTELGASAFSNCNSMTHATLSRNMTRIKNGTFYVCNQLSNVIIPEGIMYIERSAFSWCDLRSVIIPRSVINLEQYAFYCNWLENVSFLQDAETVVTIADDVFRSTPTIYCYEYSSAEGYANDRGWTIVLLDRNDISDVRSLNLEDDFRLSCGMTRNLLVTVFPDQPAITWSSSDPTIVTVVDGVVNALKPGIVTITASVGSLSDTVLISVFTMAESFELNYDEAWIVAKDTLDLEAVNILPVGADTELLWNSSDTTIATVSNSGKVTTKKPGEVIITATDISTGLDCTALLHVCYPVSAVNFETDSQSIIPRQEKQLIANVTMRSQSCINRFVTFTSSNEGIVVVGEKTGIIKGVAPGTAIITVAGNGYSDTCTVIVREPNILILPVGISIIESEAFRGMPNVDAIKLPGDLTEIADDAFDDGVIIIAPTMSNTAEWAEEHGFDVIEE